MILINTHFSHSCRIMIREKKNDMNLTLYLQNFDEQKTKIIIKKTFSQITISKMKMNNSFDEKAI